MTSSGRPVYLARSAGSWVAMPTEHVLRWHLRSITQPVAISDAVARPSSHGSPACLMLDSGAAPVPPSVPAMTTQPARALATPAAIVPTPYSLTSLTLTRAVGLTHVRS